MQIQFQEKSLVSGAALLRDVAIALIVLFFCCLCSLLYSADGPSGWSLLWSHEAHAQSVLFSLRLPRILLGVCTGAVLAASGTALQALLQNPLADPYVLGLSGGAALGGTLGLLLQSSLAALLGLSFGGSLWVPLCAFLGALGAMAFLQRLSRLGTQISAYTFLLAGAVCNSFAAALVTFIQSVVSAEQSQEILFWLIGSLSTLLSWPTLLLVICVTLCVLVALLWQTPAMNACSLGDEFALVIGVKVSLIQRRVFWLVSLALGVVVSFAGLIGFVGLLVPHGLRLLVGADLRRLLPLSAIYGAAFLVLCDMGTRMLFSLVGTEPPVGVITALLGGPFFLWLLSHGNRN